MMDNDHISWLGMLRWVENRSDAAPTGEFFAPSQEALQLHASTRLGFPACAIESIVRESVGQNAARSKIVSPLFGLSGPVAALPYAYTEQLARSKRENGAALTDFFDIFNHRSQSLLYRALRKHRYVLGKERALAGGEQDSYSNLLSALGGSSVENGSAGASSTDIGNVRNHDESTGDDVGAVAIPRDALTRFAGLFARRTRSACGLAQMLQRYFGLDIRIREFAGRWIVLDKDMQSRIGSSGNNNQLGSCLLGRRSWQAQAFFCIEIHDPDAHQFAALKPDGGLLHAMHLMVRRYAGEEFGFHFEIFIKPQLASVRLAHRAKTANGENTVTQLGWNGVLGRTQRSDGAVVTIRRLSTLKTDHNKRGVSE